MKKGYTLIEMLGIVTVLGVILLVTFPSLNNSLKQMKKNSKDNFTNNLKISTETYIELYKEKYPELNTPGGSTKITLKTLYDTNLLTGKTDYDLNSEVTITRNNENILIYYYNGKQIGIEE